MGETVILTGPVTVSAVGVAESVAWIVTVDVPASRRCCRSTTQAAPREEPGWQSARDKGAVVGPLFPRPPQSCPL